MKNPTVTFTLIAGGKTTNEEIAVGPTSIFDAAVCAQLDALKAVPHSQRQQAHLKIRLPNGGGELHINYAQALKDSKAQPASVTEQIRRQLRR